MENEQGYKVVLNSGKEVLLREPKIKHRNLAAKAVAGQSQGDQFVFVVMMAHEMLKLLIHSVNGKKLGAKELLDLDDIFTSQEYAQLEKVMSKFTEVKEEGADAPLEPVIEVVPLS